MSGSKVVRGMAFGRESEGVFFSPPPTGVILIKPPPYPGTTKHATAAKVAVFTCTLDIAQTETEGMALIENADETTSGKEEHLAKVRRFSDFR